MKQTFYSNGKLLLTGEYLVLDGARALALPTKFGQDLTVEKGKNRQIDWKSFDADGSIWFEAIISFDAILAEKNRHEIDSIETTLLSILREAARLNPALTQNDGLVIQTHLTFPKFWGLGTSSTLINNIAQWMNIDAFLLLKNSFGGSGYDIACAQHHHPIVYQLLDGVPQVEEIAFAPEFANQLYFVYLNKKQSSKQAIAAYYNNKIDQLAQKITAVNHITEAVISASNIGIFARQLQQHENILSDLLEMKTVQETFFADFDGVIKSLGGWGGDFVLAISKNDPTDYFEARGFSTVIPYDDMILK